jgi:hypothetical protein
MKLEYVNPHRFLLFSFQTTIFPLILLVSLTEQTRSAVLAISSILISNIKLKHSLPEFILAYNVTYSTYIKREIQL